MCEPLSPPSLPGPFSRGLETTVLTSPPGYSELRDDRDEKEFSALDVYHLVAYASDALYQEAREDRRADSDRVLGSNQHGVVSRVRRIALRRSELPMVTGVE